MNLQHVNVKLFVDGELHVDPTRVIEVFHGWVSEQAFDELLIDVADYRHVPDGPGIVLVGHEADYALDNAEGLWGLLYNRKTEYAGTNADRFRQALESAARVCGLLEQEFSDLKFDRRRLELTINDRALAPNTAETFEVARQEIESFLTNALGQGDFKLTRDEEPRRRFGVAIELGEPLDLASVCAA